MAVATMIYRPPTFHLRYSNFRCFHSPRTVSLIFKSQTPRFELNPVYYAVKVGRRKLKFSGFRLAHRLSLYKQIFKLNYVFLGILFKGAYTFNCLLNNHFLHETVGGEYFH